MKPGVHRIKCRDLLGRLEKWGLEASRATLQALKPGSPDALLVAADGRAWLILIWEGTTLQPSLIEEQNATPSLEQLLEHFKAWLVSALSEAGAPSPQLVILAPALDAAEIAGTQWEMDGQKIPLLGRQECQKREQLAETLKRLTSDPIGAEAAARWRAAAVPEVKIDLVRPELHRSRSVSETRNASATPLLLDYRQERCARLDLEPDESTRPLVADWHVRVITGVAGCGKTLVLVHRAALLARHFPNATVLLLSHNRPLIADLRRRLNRMGLEGRITCSTFYQWLARISPARGEAMQPRETIQWIEKERQVRPYSNLAKMSPEWLAEEISWMLDQGLADDSYLGAERKGRGTRTQVKELQRREILTLLGNYRIYLREQNRFDWAEWPLRVRDAAATALRHHQADHLLIDEAQFFAPVWFDLLRGAVKPGGHIFLCADPTQGFLRRRMSWGQLGFQVPGRAHRLERPYRNTRAILQFALDFYRNRLPADEDPLNLPSPDWLDTMEPGVQPMVQPSGRGLHDLHSMTAELRNLDAKGISPAEILILVAGRRLTSDLVINFLFAEYGRQIASHVKDDTAPPDTIGVAHLMAATGLEKPIVFLLGADDLIAEENNPELTEDQREEKRRDTTRQLYMGITRTMDRLVIYGNHPDLNPEIKL